jgi:serine/threonine-protein kinase
MIGTVLSERYRIEAKLGSGGMSTVYLARDETLDRPVAIKVLHREMSEQPDQIERFRQEARAVAKLSHPAVVSVIDAGDDRGHPYIVFEYVEGETLKQRIARLGALDVQDALAYAIEIARGLGVAHSRNLVHRDVKPQNVLINMAGRAKVTDFGIARQLEQAGMTATGRVLGTTDYVAPEQAMGQGVDQRSDIYSLGIVLYEMLTGEIPFTADSQVGVAMKHVNEELPDVQTRRPEVSAAVALVVERSTAKSPAHRYQTIEEMEDDLETALEVEAARTGTTTAEATSVLETVPQSQRKLRGRARWSLAGVLLLLVLAGATLGVVHLISSGALGGGGDEDDEPAAPDVAPVALVSAQDFDPEGTSGEHPEEVELAIDDDPDTAWTTEDYETADYGKSGVGLIVETGRDVTPAAIEINTPDPGWAMTVYASTGGPPEALEGWTELGQVEEVTDGDRLALDIADQAFRYFLIWSTSPTKTDDGYGASISEVRVIG